MLQYFIFFQKSSTENTPVPGHSLYGVNQEFASSNPAANVSWPLDLKQQYSPSVSTYPSAFGPGLNSQATSPSLQSPPPFLSQPPPQVHYQMQQHVTYGSVLPPPPPPPPPPQPMPASSYGTGNHAYAGPSTGSSEMAGTVFEYDHGQPGGGPGPSTPSAIAKNRGSNLNNLTVLSTGKPVQRHEASYAEPSPMENRTRFHPPDPQYFDAYGNNRAPPSARHYAPMNRGNHSGRGSGRY